MYSLANGWAYIGGGGGGGGLKTGGALKWDFTVCLSPFSFSFRRSCDLESNAFAFISQLYLFFPSLLTKFINVFD